MTDPDRPEPTILPDTDGEIPADADQEKLDELMEKDAKSGRRLGRIWYLVTAGLSIFMVAFYIYNSGVQPVSTQYHKGIYVLVTFVMVFLAYPMTSRSRVDRPSISDMVRALIAICVGGYWIIE